MNIVLTFTLVPFSNKLSQVAFFCFPTTDSVHVNDNDDVSDVVFHVVVATANISTNNLNVASNT